MKKTDLQTLKSKHRLELVMQEFGEQFDIRSDQWISRTTPGLIVNISMQTYEYQKPGLEKQSGDLFSWLRLRFTWTFKQAVQYLRKREPDPEFPTDAQQSLPEAEEAKIVPLVRLPWKFESKFLDDEKDSSGLYDRGVVNRGAGKEFYQYLLKPLDQWQERALEIGGEEMRECFTWEAWEIDSLLRSQPSRFAPVMDMDIERCDECEKSIDWWWKKKPCYSHQETFEPGIRFGATFKKTRIYPVSRVYAFEYELYEETFCICEDCMRKKINYREALSLLYKSARKRKTTSCLMQKEGET